MDSDDKGDIEIPNNLLVLDNDKPLPSLVDFVYSNILENLSVPNFFEERGILAPTLEIVEEVNEFISSYLLESSLNQDINEIKLSIFEFFISKNPPFSKTLYH